VSKQRLEAFTDGVIAIIVTIMVLDMKVPAGSDVAALKAGLPVFLCAQLHECGHFLEQSSSHAAHYGTH
jgi:hypothetical protein